MIRITLIIASILCFATQNCSAQRAQVEMPFPRTKGVRKAIQHYVSFTQDAAALSNSSSSNTIYLFNKDGYVTEMDILEDGKITSKIVYEYKNGLMIKQTHFLKPDGTDKSKLPDSVQAGSLIKSSVDTWEYYKDNKLKAKHVYYGKPIALDNEILYSYNLKGNLKCKYYKYYKIPGGFYHPNENDSSVYRKGGTEGDSIYVFEYKNGKLTNDYVFFERNTAQRFESYSESKDGKHFMKELDIYDDNGRILEEITLSDHPSVQADGVVLRADRVVSVYDDKGRLSSRIYYAMGVKRWQHNYKYQ